MAAEPKYNKFGMRHYDTTELIVREDILAKARELAELLSTSDEVIMYRKAEQQIKNNEKIQNLIRQIKKNKKRSSLSKSSRMRKWSKKSRRNKKRFRMSLILFRSVQQFQQTQSDINYLFNFRFGDPGHAIRKNSARS